MVSRKKIPESIRLQLWVKSAGRCEFKGCNKPVWYNGLTLSMGNFSEFAHIIGASKDGPRGNQESEDLQIEFSNLMLLCRRCHKEIDDHPKKYSEDDLRLWKQEHEDRVEIQTSYHQEVSRSTILLLSINIGERYVPVNIESIQQAMFPKFPTSLKGIKIEDMEFDRYSEASFWQSFAESKIRRKIQRSLEEGIDDFKIKHLSIFGIAPMPLLIYMGKCIGDTIPSDIYQSHRTIEDTSKTWSWQEVDDIDLSYEVHQISVGNSDRIFLKVEISDTITPDQYSNLVIDNDSVYSITISDPSPHFLKSRKQLEIFSYEYRKLINKIQSSHGKKCRIYILPAMPVSVAIESGRVLLPNKDPDIYSKPKSVCTRAVFLSA